MDFSESFSVDAALEDVWDLMTDVERIAPCLPGAQLQEIDGEDYHGIVKVKVGPITSQYKGTARFEQVDEAEHKIVLSAQGRDTKGAGNASAKIGVSLEDDATGDSPATQVMVDVHLDLKGKVAQFGRGVLADVSGKLMAKFAENLSEMIAAGHSEAGDGETAGSDAPAGSEPGGIAAGDGSTGDAEGSTLAGSAGSDGASSESASHSSTSAASSDTSRESTPRRAGEATGASKAEEADEVEAVDLLEVTGSRRVKAGIAVVGAALLAAVLFIRRLFRRKKAD